MARFELPKFASEDEKKAGQHLVAAGKAVLKAPVHAVRHTHGFLSRRTGVLNDAVEVGIDHTISGLEATRKAVKSADTAVLKLPTAVIGAGVAVVRGLGAAGLAAGNRVVNGEHIYETSAQRRAARAARRAARKETRAAILKRITGRG